MNKLNGEDKKRMKQSLVKFHFTQPLEPLDDLAQRFTEEEQWFTPWGKFERIFRDEYLVKYQRYISLPNTTPDEKKIYYR